MKGTQMVRFTLVALIVAAGLLAPRSADAGYWSTTVWHGGPVYYGPPPVYAWAPGRCGYVVRGWGYGRHPKYVCYSRPYYAAVPRGDWVQWDAPPPVAVAPAPPQISRAPAERFCREYQREVTIAGRSERAYGTACLQPDGSWQIVDERLEPR